jgi:hypothetical protein
MYSWGLDTGESDIYTEARAYCNCVSSFLLKMIEKLVERHIRDGILKEHPLHETNLPTKTEYPLKLHFIIWQHARTYI